ncbi:MAG: DUF5009 domain-containing protein [Planctomycetota bacterium]|nr:MAG: DUF5009 domain-containing protein [Planctomycetota bacterium]
METNGSSGEVKGRLVSVDALRGFDMFWIINGDAPLVFALAKATENEFLNKLLVQFEHVRWVGFRAWDLVMPLFLFIVGVVMPISFNRRLERGQGKGELWRHIIKRVLILWVLGMIAQGNLLEYNLDTLQVYSNTLQAIAAGYLIASVLILYLDVGWQMVTTAVLLLGFWVLMTIVPVPGHGAGMMTEEGNLAIYIDDIVLGRFSDGLTYTWVLSSLGFAGSVMLGAMGGHLLRSKRRDAVKVLGLFAAGVGCLVVGEFWGLLFPIIKHIWTSSMVLYAAGWSFLLLGLFYLVIDVWGFKKWAFFFVVIGMNAIAVYMAVHVFNFKLVGDIFVRGLERFCGNWYVLVREVAALAVVWLILWWMYRKKTFIKI